MKKTLLCFLTLIFTFSLVLSMNLVPVSAAVTNATLTKSASINLVPNGDCYAYVITYTYTVTNIGSSAIIVDNITDSKLGNIALPPLENDRKINGRFGAPYLFKSFTATYDATLDAKNGVVSIYNEATAGIHATGVSGTVYLAPTSSFTIPLPHYTMPSAWYLDQTGNHMDWVLAGGLFTQSSGVEIVGAGARTWISIPATTGITFDTGNWNFSMHTPYVWDEPPVVVFGEWDGTAFTTHAYTLSITDANWNGTDFTYIATLNLPGFSVAQGNSMAIRITNASQDESPAVVTCHLVGGTYLEPPQPKPNWPVPEMPTGVLLGIGLAGVGTFLFFRLKKASHPAM